MHCVCKRSATLIRPVLLMRTALKKSSVNIDTFARFCSEASHLGDLGRVREDRRPGLDLREVVLVVALEDDLGLGDADAAALGDDDDDLGAVVDRDHVRDAVPTAHGGIPPQRGVKLVVQLALPARAP